MACVVFLIVMVVVVVGEDGMRLIVLDPLSVVSGCWVDYAGRVDLRSRSSLGCRTFWLITVTLF